MMQNQLPPTHKFFNVGYIDSISRLLASTVCLTVPFTGLSGGFLVFPLLGVLVFTSAMLRWDPLYTLLKMHSRETDQDLLRLKDNAGKNLALQWQRLRRYLAAGPSRRQEAYLRPITGV